MKRKYSLLFCSIILASSLLFMTSGCKNSQTNHSETINQTDATNAVDKDEVKITVFDAMAHGLERYDALIANFEKDNPGVKVEVQHAGSDTEAILKSRFNANDAPDVFAVQTGTIAQAYYQFAYDWSDDQTVLDKFREDALNTGKDDNGHVLSLPWTYENMGLLYNKDLFAEAGITELPRTLDDLRLACQKMQDKGIQPFTISAAENWVLSQMSSHFMIDKSMDVKALAKKIRSGELRFNDMKNYKNLFEFIDIVKEYSPDKPLEVDWERAQNHLATNKAAIIHMGDWCQATLDKFNPEANLAFLPVPVSNNADDATVLSSISWTYIVNKESKNLKLAKKFCEYMLNSDDAIDWMTQTIGGVPGVKTDAEVNGDLANDASRYIQKGETDGWIHTLAPEGFNDIIGPAIQSYWLGDMSAEQVIQIAQDAWLE